MRPSSDGPHPEQALDDREPRQEQQPRSSAPRPHDRRAAALLEVPTVTQPRQEGSSSESVSFARVPHLLQPDHVPPPAHETREGTKTWTRMGPRKTRGKPGERCAQVSQENRLCLNQPLLDNSFPSVAVRSMSLFIPTRFDSGTQLSSGATVALQTKMLVLPSLSLMSSVIDPHYGMLIRVVEPAFSSQKHQRRDRRGASGVHRTTGVAFVSPTYK